MPLFAILLAPIWLANPTHDCHCVPCTLAYLRCDVLWAGCPLVTLPGERMASRVAASLVVAAGFGSELVAKDHQVGVHMVC